MLKIGLTGGIGSGKSVVASIFITLGIPVFDADREAKSIMESDKELVSSVQRIFGSDVYVNGMLNRQGLADIVFNDPKKLEQLNGLVHPAAIKAAGKWFTLQKAPYAIKEAALLFEAGAEKQLDYVIGIKAPQHLRIARVTQRDSITKEQVALRMNKQLDEEIKMKRCDFVILNDEQHLLIPQVLQLHEKFTGLLKD